MRMRGLQAVALLILAAQASAQTAADRIVPTLVSWPRSMQTLLDFFEAVAKLPEGTPVAGSYFVRGVEHHHVALAFHRVVFSKARP